MYIKLYSIHSLDITHFNFCFHNKNVNKLFNISVFYRFKKSTLDGRHIGRANGQEV